MMWGWGCGGRTGRWGAVPMIVGTLLILGLVAFGGCEHAGPVSRG